MTEYIARFNFKFKILVITKLLVLDFQGIFLNKNLRNAIVILSCSDLFCLTLDLPLALCVHIVFSRCHLNDLENIVPFCIIGLLYTLTNPSLLIAKLLLGGYTVARIFHTIVFVKLQLQPYRAISFLFSYFITFILLISFFIHVLTHLV